MDKFDPGVRSFINELEDRVEKKRDALERANKTADETAFLRGYIKATRAVISDLTGDPEDEPTDS